MYQFFAWYIKPMLFGNELNLTIISVHLLNIFIRNLITYRKRYKKVCPSCVAIHLFGLLNMEDRLIDNDFSKV